MIIRGKNVSKETIRNTNKVKKVFMKRSFKDDIINDIKAKKIPYEFIDDNQFENKYQNAQGIACLIDDYKYYELDECLNDVSNNSLVLILDSIEDPQNLGNIIRTFEILGGSFIIIPKNRSVDVTDTVMKVSCGAYNFVKIVKVTNLTQAINKLKEKGFWVLAADMNGTEVYSEVRVDMPLAVIVGNEGFGISKHVKENADILVRIPMEGKINSLNASISAAIILSNIKSRRK